MTIGEIIKEKDIETYNKLMNIAEGKQNERNNNSKQDRKTNRKY